MANGKWHIASGIGEGVAWLVPRALVHAGEAGLKGIDAGGLPLKGGQKLPLVGVELLQDGEVAGMDMVFENNQFGVEVGSALGSGLGGFAAKSLLATSNAEPIMPTTAATPSPVKERGDGIWGLRLGFMKRDA